MGTIGGIRRRQGEGKNGRGGTSTAGNWNDSQACVNTMRGTAGEDRECSITTVCW